MKWLQIMWLILIATGCATGEKNSAITPHERNNRRIDFMAVQHDLGMEVPPHWVGFREKRFDACQMAAVRLYLPDCSRAYFIQVGVQLSCRPTEEAQNGFLGQSDLTPVRNRELYWRLGKAWGRIRTNSGGYGLILAIASDPMRRGEVRISTGNDFLIMPAREATHIVTPVSWCR